MQYITNATAIILFFSNGEKARVEKTDKNYSKVLKTFELPKEDQEQAVRNILKPLEITKDVIKHEGFEVVDDTVFYQGEELPPALVDKVLSIIRDGLPLEHFEKFWLNLRENPSYHVVNETGFFEFLEYKELPITEDGHFLAYRGVLNDYWSVSGDPSTKVLQGKVNGSGQIYNGIGEVIEVVRNGVCDDRNIHCAAKSLHIGSLDYAKSWATRVIVVKVNPKDVVSVPKDCNAQKCRVCKYEVLMDYAGEIESSVVTDEGKDLVPDSTKERNDLIRKVELYLENKADQGIEQVTIRQIQNSFSPIWPTKESILDALQELWYDWTEDEGVIMVDTYQ